MNRLLGRIRSSQAGDTIIEVSLALTVLALVLGTSTVLANRNTKTLQNAQEQNIAARYAQQQLEYLKTRVAANPTILSSAPAKFCMTSADAAPVNADTDPNCKITNQGATYEQSITLTPVAGNDQLYTAKATVQWDTLTTWVDSSGNTQNRGNVQLTYRVYTKLGAKRDPNSTNCGPGLVWLSSEARCVPAPKVTLAASPTAIYTGKSSNLSWSSANVATCTASGSWSGPQGTSGNKTVFPVATGSYTLTCSGAAGSAAASATITVTPPPPPRQPLYRCYQFNTFTGNPQILTNHIFTTNSAECTGGNAGGQYEGVTAYVPLPSNSGAIPMYGGRNPVIQDDFYTTNYQEYYNAHYAGWNVNSGVRFYVYPYNGSCTVPGTTPLYRWYSGVTGDHVYPVSAAENPNNYAPADGGGTFVYEGIAGCVFSGPPPATD